jgi:hypothetical protein
MGTEFGPTNELFATLEYDYFLALVANGKIAVDIALFFPLLLIKAHLILDLFLVVYR